MTIKIGLVGDYSPEVAAHVAIPKALALAANAASESVERLTVTGEADTLRL